ncbi:hypothetical protein WMF30_10805 [Sorangium sp. So ce134]
MTTVREFYPRLSAEHLAAAEELFGRLRVLRGDHGLKRSDAWLAEIAVDAALRGAEVGGLWR